MSDDLERKLYAAFDPAQPVAAGDTSLYVELDSVRGDDHIVQRMAKKIRLSADKPTCQVLAGHRGSGKTTELYRLKKELEIGDPKFFVVFCQADDDIDRNDVDFPDLLVAIVRQMAKQLNERADIKIAPGYFKDRLQRLGKLLTSDIDFDKFDLEIGLATLGTTIKGSPDAREKIREIMEPDTGNLLHAANEVISQAVKSLSKKHPGGLVILVDDLDKMVVRPHDRAGCSTSEHLFVHRAAQLRAFHCQVVYTMPISLAYSHQENAIKANYGGHVPVVPMTKIANKPPGRKPYFPGIEKFREMIEKRIRSAGATVGDLFADGKVRDHLIALSGGQPFALMTLIREAIITHGLPVGEAALQRVLREGQREYARQLREEHTPILESVRNSGEVKRTAKNEEVFRELLEGRAILQYVNDKEWYGLNPMVEALHTAPKQPAKSKAKPRAKATRTRKRSKR